MLYRSDGNDPKLCSSADLSSRQLLPPPPVSLRQVLSSKCRQHHNLSCRDLLSVQSFCANQLPCWILLRRGKLRG